MIKRWFVEIVKFSKMMANQQSDINENGGHKKPPEKCSQFTITMAGCYSSYDTKLTYFKVLCQNFFWRS
jgi:hypothetical protein